MIGAASITSLWRTHKVLVVAILTIVPLLAGIMVYRHVVSIPRLTALEKTYLQRQTQARQERAGRARVQGPVAEFQRNLKDLRSFDENLPAERELSKLIEELYELVSAAGLDIASVTYQTTVHEEAKILAYTLQFSLKGVYPRVKRFLYSLETSQRLISIDSLGLSGDEDGGALRLKLTTYFRTEEP